MPLHFYAPTSPPCKLCGEGFEHRSEPATAALTACPQCGQPVVLRPVQLVNSLKLSAAQTVSRAKHAGFTLLQRTNDGAFERQ